MRKKNKILSVFLAVLLLLSVMSVTAFADDNTPTYTINIPTDTTLEYGNTDRQYIGTVSISDPQNFEDGQRVYVGMVGTNLKKGENEIAVTYTYDCQYLSEYGIDISQRAMVYEKADAASSHGDLYPTLDLYAAIAADAWANAASGSYTATVTYSFAAE